jgi:hypothetical protein
VKIKSILFAAAACISGLSAMGAAEAAPFSATITGIDGTIRIKRTEAEPDQIYITAKNNAAPLASCTAAISLDNAEVLRLHYDIALAFPALAFSSSVHVANANLNNVAFDNSPTSGHATWTRNQPVACAVSHSPAQTQLIVDALAEALAP